MPGPASGRGRGGPASIHPPAHAPIALCWVVILNCALSCPWHPACLPAWHAAAVALAQVAGTSVAQRLPLAKHALGWGLPLVPSSCVGLCGLRCVMHTSFLAAYLADGQWVLADGCACARAWQGSPNGGMAHSLPLPPSERSTFNCCTAWHAKSMPSPHGMACKCEGHRPTDSDSETQLKPPPR